MSTAIQVPVHKQIFSIVIWSMTYLFVFLLIKDWSKSTGGGGWAGAFRNALVRKHMTHSFQLEQNGVTHP